MCVCGFVSLRLRGFPNGHLLVSWEMLLLLIEKTADLHIHMQSRCCPLSWCLFVWVTYVCVCMYVTFSFFTLKKTPYGWSRAEFSSSQCVMQHHITASACTRLWFARTSHHIPSHELFLCLFNLGQSPLSPFLVKKKKSHEPGWSAPTGHGVRP